MKTPLTTLLFAFTPALALAQSNIIQLSPGDSIDNAIAGAGTNDILLLASGTYGEFTVDSVNAAKNLVIENDGSGPVLIDVTGAGTAVTIADVPINARVTISGIDFVRDRPSQVAMEVSNSGGSIWVEDCDFTVVSSLSSAANVSPTIDVENTGSFQLMSCRVEGWNGFTSLDNSVDGSPAVRLTNSIGGLWDSSLQGGKGAPAFYAQGTRAAGTPGSPGQPAVIAAEDAGDSTVELFLSGCDLAGGEGGDSLGLFDFDPNGNLVQVGCLGAGNGGPGLRLNREEARSLGANFSGGPGGPSVNGCPGGAQGPEIESTVFDGGHQSIGDSSRLMDTAQYHYLDTDTAVFSASGAVAETNFLVVVSSPVSNVPFSGAVHGILAITASGTSYGPVLVAAGDASISVDLAAATGGSIPSGMGGTIYAQGVFFGGGAGFYVTNPLVRTIEGTPSSAGQ